MKHTPLAHPRTRTRLGSLLLWPGLCLTLPAAELQFSLTPTADNRQLGTAYAPAGDIDGTTDIAVADPSYRSGTVLGSGTVYIVSGANGTMLRAYQPEVAAASQYFGISLAALDADGDGTPDLAVGSPGYAGSTGYGTGAVRVYSGADGSLLSTSTGTAASQYGTVLANAGDQNGDGCDDLYIGAPAANGNRGAVYVRSGLDGSTLRSIDSAVTFASFGMTLAALGDLDGDGLNDVAIGSPGFRSGTIANAGKVSIIRSSDGGIAAETAGTAVYNRLGQTLAPAADANGDGLPDLMIGSYSGGIALLVSGSDLSLLRDLTIPSFPAYQPVNAGGSVDYDKDGTADLMIGSPALNQSTTPATGGVRILSGADGSVLFESSAAASFTGLGNSMAPLPGFGFAIGENMLADPATGGSGFAHLYCIEQEQAVLDSDGDGIPDDVDAVPLSIMDATVAILGTNSSVPNRVDATGTSLADRFAALGLLSDYRRPVQYLLAATVLTAELLTDELVTRKEAVRLIAATASGILRASRCR